jgi:hypothetical protein
MGPASWYVHPFMLRLWDYRLETLWIVTVDLTVFFLIGLGPALVLLRKRDRNDANEGKPWEMAPCLGFCLTLIVGTALIELGLPVARWCYGWVALAGVGSLACVLLRRPLSFSNSLRSERRWSLGVTFTTLLLVTAPVLIGGAAFVVMRGNAWDTFNYIEMAYVLDELPYPTVLQSTFQELADQAPEYAMGRDLLTVRWGTSAVLAFCAHPAGVSVYRCEYAYPALMFVLAAAPAFRLGRWAGLNPAYAALAALALTTGFYAQALLDLRAFSQANSLPLILFGMLTVVRGCAGPPNARPLAAVAIFFGALLLAYVEIVPLVAMAGAIGIVRALVVGTLSGRTAAALVAAILAGVVLALPSTDVLWRFMQSQLRLVVHTDLPFSAALFPWLLQWPLVGIWGLNFAAHIPSMDHVVGPLLPAIFLAAAFAPLWLLLARAVLLPLLPSGPIGPEPPAFTFLCAFLLAGCVQCGVLLALDRMYAVCKGFLYVMPFAFLAMPCVALHMRDSPNWRGRFTTVCWTAAVVWLSVHCLWGVIRVGCAVAERDYVDYNLEVSAHPYYRQHDLDFRTFQPPLAEHRRALSRPSVIWVVTPDFFLNRYLTYAFRDQRIVLSTGVIGPDGRELLAFQHALQEHPDFLIVLTKQVRAVQPPLQSLVAANEELALLRAPHDLAQLERLVARFNGSEKK